MKTNGTRLARRARSLAVAAASLLALAAPPSAGAASGSPAAVSGVPARAATQQGRFDGQISVSRDAASGTDIVARGRLQGRLRDRRYPSAQPIDQAFSTLVTVAAGPAGAPCGNLTLRFAGKTVRLFGLRAALAPRTVAVHRLLLEEDAAPLGAAAEQVLRPL